MLRKMLLISIFFAAAPWAAGQDCSVYNYTAPAYYWNQSGAAEHTTGSHTGYSTLNGSCTYSGTSGPCFSACDAWDTYGDTFITEQGTLSNLLYTHHVDATASGGSSNGNGPAISCAVTAAATVRSCLLSCAVSITFDATGNGVGTSVNFPPDNIFAAQHPYQTNCAAEIAPTPPPPTCNMGADICTNCVPPQCPPTTDWDPALCECFRYTSPIIIDTDGSGFHLTTAADGVLFDFYGTGQPIQIAWTAKNSTNGWLALDRNHNGLIDSAKELFGNITEQPASDDQNGFLALAVFDTPAGGGNDDGVIDQHDAVWPELLVWIDANHDGVSQPDELHHLDDIGVHSISLKFKESRFTDAYGNQFRYKGRLNPERHETVNRVIYDVFLAHGATSAPKTMAGWETRLKSKSLASLLLSP